MAESEFEPRSDSRTRDLIGQEVERREDRSLWKSTGLNGLEIGPEEKR